MLNKPISQMSEDEIILHIESLRRLRQEARFKPPAEKKAERKTKRQFNNPIQEVTGELSDILGKLLNDNDDLDKLIND